MPTASMDDNPGFDVDECISKLLEVRGGKPGKLVQLTEGEVRTL